jgi:lysozyme
MENPRRQRTFRRTLVAAAAALAVYVAGDGHPGSVAWAGVCPGPSTQPGVDVSSFDGTVNWPQVAAAGYKFGIARVSDGSSVIDPQFAANWAGMSAAGMIRGAYHTFEPAQDPVAQANLVISKVGVLKAGDLPVTADMEVTGGQSAAVIVANLQTWVSRVQAGTGKAPMIYTSTAFWSSLGEPTAFSNLALWVAQFSVTCPTLPTPWSNWVFWQNSASGSVPGITGSVDVDEFNGNLAALQAFAAPVAAPALPPFALVALAASLLFVTRAYIRGPRPSQWTFRSLTARISGRRTSTAVSAGSPARVARS